MVLTTADRAAQFGSKPSSMSLSTRSYSHKTMSVYGGAGGRGTRISSTQPCYSGTSGGFNLADGLDLQVSTNEKATMQNLNDRLASYLEKVRSLEKENDRLDRQIKDWYQSRVITSHDYTSYFVTMDDLKDKVRRVSCKLHSRFRAKFQYRAISAAHSGGDCHKRSSVQVMFDIVKATFSVVPSSARWASGCSLIGLLLFLLQIRIASKLNAKTVLDIDNAKLAADDFKMK